MGLRLSLFAALLLTGLCACTKPPKPRGDAEAVHGGDPADIVLNVTRQQLVSAAHQLIDGVESARWQSYPGCPQTASSALCDTAAALPTDQYLAAGNFLSRNAAQILNLNLGAAAIAWLPTNEERSLPSGRTVLAWIDRDENGRTVVRIHRDVLKLSEGERLALLTHEVGHLVVDATIGHSLIDEETVSGFVGAEGSGRNFLDRVGLVMALYGLRETAHNPNFQAPYQLESLTRLIDHGDTYVPGRAMWADINGDGRTDLIFQGNTALFLSLGNANGTLSAPQNALTLPAGLVPGQVQFADIDGDGRKDAIVQTNDNRFLVALSEGTRFGALTQSLQHGDNFVPGLAQYADVNGDGRADLLFENTAGRVYLSLSEGSALAGQASLYATLPGSFNIGQVHYADVTGDRKADLLFESVDGVHSAFYALGSMLSGAHLIFDHGDSFANGRTFYADSNGDGKADLFHRDDQQLWLSRFAANGDPLQPQSIVTLGASDEILVGDLNGDGKADVLIRHPDNRIQVAIAGSGGYTTRYQMTINAPFIAGQVALADVNGDHRIDLTFIDNNNDIWVALSAGVLP